MRNRIAKLEADGIIEGYHPKIDYEAATLPLQVLFVCTAPPTERAAMVEQVLDVRAVVDVREPLIGHRNVYVEALTNLEARDADPTVFVSIRSSSRTVTIVPIA